MLQDVLDSEEEGVNLYWRGPPPTMEWRCEFVAGTFGGLVNLAAPPVSSSPEGAPS